MPLFHAIRRLWNDWLDAERSASRARRSAELAYPRLYGIQLEERQLLDAAPLVQLTAGGLLTVGAGAGADDGQADQFAITESRDESGSRIDVRVNGEDAGSFDKSAVSQIRVVGSSDADTLVLDPLAAPPGGILFEGAGNPTSVSDQLILQSPAINDLTAPVHVQHVMTNDGGSITIDSTAVPASFVEYVGVEQVTDQLQAESRSLELAAGVSARLESDSTSGISRLESSAGATVDILNPTQSLAVTALGAASSEPFNDSQPDVNSDAARIRFDGDLTITGGQIRFDAGEGGLLEVAGSLSTADSRVGELGGPIHLLGDRVYVRDGAVIDASGEAGGGEILVGGGQTGADPNVRNARYTWLEAGATLSANALGTGMGGRVIVWADVMAAVHGDIYAMGGIGGGDGGFVETSGLVDLVVLNAPNVSAPQGAAGVWLIDPLSITIVSSGANTAVTAASPFTPTGAGAQLNIATLRIALEGGANVVVQTAAGAGSGDITLAAELDLDELNGASLTFNAHGDIILSERIFDSDTVTVDRVNLTFNSNTDNSGGGDIRLNNATLNSGGGSITFSDPVIVGANVTIDSRTAAGAGGAIVFSGTVNADNSSANNRTLVVNAGDSTVTFSGVVGGATNGALADLDVTGSTITLSANVTANDAGGSEATFTGNVVLAADVTITTVGSAVSNSLRVTGALAGDSGYSRRLDVSAGAGDVNFAANVDQLGLFRIRSAANVSLQSVTTGGTISGVTHTIHIGADSAVNSVVLRGDLRTNGLAGATSGIRINSNNAIQLDALSVSGGSILLQTDGTTTTDGAITFVGTSTISSLTPGLDGLRINAGSNSLNLSGLSLNTLDHLVVSTASNQSVTLGALSLADGGGNSGSAISVSSGTIGLTGNLTAQGDVSLTGVVELRGNIVITTSGAPTSGDVTITGLTRADNSTANNRSLQVNAGAHDVVFAGDIGSGSQSALAGLAVTAAKITLSGSNVVVDDTTATAATIALNGAVVLANSVAFDLDGSSGADNNLTITGSVNADDSTTFDRSMTINAGGGTVEIAGAVGQNATGALADLDITAASVRLGGNIRVDDPGVDPATATITFSGAVTLTANVLVDVDASTGVDNNVAFSQTVSGDAIANNRRLTIVAGGGDVVFSQAVDKLALFRIDSADDVQLAAVTVHGTVVANTIDLGAVSALGSLALRGDLRTDGAANAGNIRIQSSGDVSLDAPGASAGTIRFDTDATGGDGSVVFVGATTVKSVTENLDGWTLVIGDNSLDLASVSMLDLDHLSITAGAAETATLGGLSLGEGDATAQVALAVTAGTIELRAAITTGSGAVLLDGGVVLSGDVTIDTTNAGTGADIEVTGTIDADDASAADRSLTMNVGTADIRLQDSIGAGVSGALAGLTLTAATIELGGAEIVVNDPGAAASTILFDGAVLLTQSVRIDVDTGAAPFNSVRFSGRIDNVAATPRALMVLAGDGEVSLEQAVGLGANGALADLDITAQNIRLFDEIHVDGDLSDGVVFTGAVELAGDVVVHTASGAGAEVTFTAAINADAVANQRTLNVAAGGGAVVFGAGVGVGANGALADLDVTAATMTFSGDVLIKATGGNGVVLTGDVLLAQDTMFDTRHTAASGYDVRFAGRIDNAAATPRALTVLAGDGKVSLEQAVGLGANGALADLDITAQSIRLFDEIHVDGDLSDGVVFTGAVELAGDVLVDTASGAGAEVTFTAAINADSVANQRTLNVAAGGGAVVFGAGIGVSATGALADLDVTAATMTFSGDVLIKATGGNGVVLSGDVLLAQDTMFDTRRTAALGYDVRFAGRIDNAAATPRALTVLAGDGEVSLEQAVGLGANGALADLDITAQNIRLFDEIYVDGDLSDGVVFTGAVELAGDVLVDTASGAGAEVTFTAAINADSVANQRTLNVAAGGGAVVFGAGIGVGANGALADLDVTAATMTFSGDVLIKATGGNGVVLTGDVLLAQDTMFDTRHTGPTGYDLRFAGRIDNSSAIPQALTVLAGSGEVALEGPIGSGVNGALADLDVTAQRIRLFDEIHVDGVLSDGVVFTGVVELAGDVLIDASTGVGADISFTSTVDADLLGNQRQLTVRAGDGRVTFTGPVGSVASLSTLDVTAAEIALHDDVTVQDAGGTGVLFDGAVLLFADVVINTNGATVDNAVRFDGTVDGAGGGAGRKLTIDSGTATTSLLGTVGGVTALADLDITAATIVLGDRLAIDAAGGDGVTFNGDVLLAGNVSLDTDRTSGDYSISFNGRVDADNASLNNRSLTINAGTEAVVFAGEIGAKAQGALHFLDVTADEIRVSGRVIADDAGGATTAFRGDLFLDGNVTIDVDRAASTVDNNVLFTGVVRADDSTANDRRLTVVAGNGTATFQEAIGSGAVGQLANLDVTAATIFLANSVIVDDGPGGGILALRGAVVLNGNVTLDTAGSATANDVLVTNAIQGDSAANNRQFTVIAGTGDVSLNGAASALALFRIDSANDVVLNGVSTAGRATPRTIDLGSVSSLGSLTLRGDLRTDAGTDAGDIYIDVTGAITLDAPGSGSIAFDTDAAGIDGSVALAAGLNFVSATPFQDGLAFRVGASTLDLRTAVLSGLDHLIVQTDSAHDVILGSLSLGDGAGSGGLGALSITTRTAILTANIQTSSDPSQSGGDVLFDANVRLEANVDIHTAAPGGAGDVTIRGSVNADSAVANDRVFRIFADGAAVRLANVGDAANGAVSQLIVRAGTTTLTGSLVNAGDANAASRQIDFQQGNVVLANTMTMTLGPSAQPGDKISFAALLNADGVANRELTLNAAGGQIFFFGSVGAAPNGALARLDAAAAEIVVAAPVVNLSAAGGRTSVFTGLTVLASNVQFITDNSTATDNSLVFAGIVRADSSVIQSRILIIQAGNGSVIFEQDVGGGANGSLAGMSVSANTINFRGPMVIVDDATTGQLVSLVGNVVVANNALLFDLDTNGIDNSLQITGTVNADDSSSFARGLTIQAGGGSVTLNGNVGAGTNGALVDLDVFANLIVLGGSTIQVDDAGGDGIVTFGGEVRLANDVSIDTDATAGTDKSVVFQGAVNADNQATQNRRLNIQAGSASVSFLADIGGGANGALAELDVTASQIQLLTPTIRIDDAGNRESHWSGTVTLGADVVTIDLDGVAAVDNRLTVVGPVVADDAVNFDRELVILGGNGTVSLLGGVGQVGGFELAGLKVQAGLYRLGGQFLIDDGGGRSIEFRGDGQLAADVVFDIDGTVDNSLTFFGAGASIDSDSTATPRRLTIIADQGSIAFEAALGDNTPLAGLDVVTAQNLTLSRVTTMGNSGGYTIHLGSASAISGQLALTGDLRTNQGAAAGGIRIQASGPVIIEASGAGTAGSIRLDTDLAGSTLDGAIVFVGGANFRSANPFEDGLALSAGSQSVDLANANLVQLDHLRVSTASDQTVTLGGVSVGDGAGSGVGAAIDVTTGVTRLRGNLVTNNETTGGAVVLRSAVELGGSIDIVTNTNGVDGRVEILGNVRADDQVAFDRDLEVNSGDAETWFRGDVGAGPQGALAGLSVTAGNIRLAGANVIVNDATTGTTVLLAGDVTLENNVLFLTDSVAGIDNNVTFARSVKSDSAALNNRRLTVEAGGGTARFLGTVGVGGALADLDVAASATQLGGDLRIDDQGGNTITFQGAVQLLGNIAIDVAGPPDNHLEFVGPLSTIDGDSAANSRGLSITAGQGNVTLGGAVGGNQRIGQLTIVSARDVAAQGAIQATGVSQLAGSGDSTFRGAVATAGPNGVALATAGLIDMQSDVTATGGGSVRFTQGRALRLAGNVLADGGFLENGAGTVTLTAGKSVSTTGDTLEFQSVIQLTGGGGIVQLDSTQGGQVAGNDITLRGSVDATTPAPNAESLTLNAGTAGNILFEGPVGGTATLGVLRINNAADVTFDDKVTVAGLLQFNGQAGKTTRFQDSVNITSNLGLFLDTAGDIQLNGSLNNTGGGLVEFRNGGELAIASDIVSNGSVRQSGAGGVSLVGSRSISTSGQIVDIFGPVSLQGAGATPSLTINTAGGNIVLRSSVDSPTPGALRLDAGATGDIELRGALGSVGVLREVAVVNTNDLLVSGSLRAGSFRQQAGTGNTSLTGSLETIGAGGIEVTTSGNLGVNRLLAQGNVPLTLIAGNDVTIGANGEVFVTGNAPSTALIINAGDDLVIDPTARLRVGTGASQAVASGIRPVVTVTPVADPFGVSVNEQGETTVRVQVGTAGSEEQNVDLRIDWEKGQFSPLPGTVNDPDFMGSGRVYTFDYQYNGNPSPNPTDPIPISITAAFDPRIQLSNQGGAILGTVQLTALLQPPNGGLFGFNVIVPGEEPIPRREPSRPAEIAVIPAPTPVPIAQRFDPGSSPTATTVERTREVQLRVVTLNSQGQPEDSDEFIPLDEGELNNLPELFQSLPDNRYRIYLRTENGSRRLIRDVVIRNRKVVELDESTGTVEAEPAEETRPPQESLPENSPAAEPELNRASRREIRFEASQDQELTPWEGRTPALAAALVSASSLVGGVPRGAAADWRQRARRALLASVTRTNVRRDNEDQCH